MHGLVDHGVVAADVVQILSGCISDETKTTSSYLVPENENERQLRRQLLRHITEWSNDFGTSMSLRAIIRAKEEVSLRSGAALKEKILYSYRQVYKEAFRAIRYASPSRYTLRKVINNAFRTAPLSEFNPEKISNTIKFLHNASKENGLEHKIVKSLLHTWWFEGQLERVQPTHKPATEDERKMKEAAFKHFELTLKLLNEDMWTCLPTSAFAAVNAKLDTFS